VIFCVDEFGPLNLQPRPGRQWAAVSGKGREPGREPRPRMRAACTRTEGVRHLFAACELGEDKLFGHIKPRKTRGRFLEFCRYLRTLYPPQVRIAIICDNFSPHGRHAGRAAQRPVPIQPGGRLQPDIPTALPSSGRGHDRPYCRPVTGRCSRTAGTHILTDHDPPPRIAESDSATTQSMRWEQMPGKS
jgi:hypothetical protein